MELLSTRQVAEELGVSESRVRQLVAEGLLKTVDLDTPSHFFTRQAVEAYRSGPRPKRGRPAGKKS